MQGLDHGREACSPVRSSAGGRETSGCALRDVTGVSLRRQRVWEGQRVEAWSGKEGMFL